MAQPIRIVRQGAITRITIDRADAGNRVTNEMAATLAGAIGSAGAEGTHLVVLAGEGADFCLGREVPASAEGGTETAVGIRAANTEPALALFATFQRCPAPILGIVQGRATGMGCAMAALCDVTLAADDARFLVPEMDRDLPPTLVMWALADRLTRKAASYLVYSREPMDAQAALSAGLVSRVVAGADLAGAAEALIEKLAGNSGPALRAVKEYMRSAPEMDRQGAADFASNLLANVLASR